MTSGTTPTEQLTYSGRWEYVYGRPDGRYLGMSARTHHLGDSVSIVFQGQRLFIYGIKGRNGGRAELIIPGQRTHTLSFYAPSAKATRRVVYDSGNAWQPGVHSASLVVIDRGGASPGYVNVDEFRVAGAP